jgi:hypothetical protein
MYKYTYYKTMSNNQDNQDDNKEFDEFEEMLSDKPKKNNNFKIINSPPGFDINPQQNQPVNKNTDLSEQNSSSKKIFKFVESKVESDEEDIGIKINKLIKKFNINSDSTSDDDEDELYYPDPDIDLWESFLNRTLEPKEKEFIMGIILEKDTNQQIDLIHKNMLKSGIFCIPKLTSSRGNCLFESLEILELGDSMEIRNKVAEILLAKRNDKTFFSHLDISPEEIFTNANDVQTIFDKKEQQYYPYDYDRMIMDLKKKYSWKHLPTELILMAISRIYSIAFNIFNNKSEYISIVNTWNNSDSMIRQIYLGHINEEHYIPVIKIPQELSEDMQIVHEFINKLPKYNGATNRFNSWAKNLVNNINKEEKENSSNVSIIIKQNQNQNNDFEEVENLEDFTVIL